MFNFIAWPCSSSLASHAFCISLAKLVRCSGVEEGS